MVDLLLVQYFKKFNDLVDEVGHLSNLQPVSR